MRMSLLSNYPSIVNYSFKKPEKECMFLINKAVGVGKYHAYNIYLIYIPHVLIIVMDYI